MRATLFLTGFLALSIGIPGGLAEAKPRKTTTPENTKPVPTATPAPPLVAPVPVNADWTLTMKYPGPKAKAAGRLTEVHTTKTGKTRRDRIAYAGKGTEEHWYVNTLALWGNAQGEVSAHDLSSVPYSESADLEPSIATGFPGVRWVKLDYFDKLLAYEKKTLLPLCSRQRGSLDRRGDTSAGCLQGGHRDLPLQV